MKTRIKRVATIVVVLLLLAFIANFTVEGWNWGVLDFVTMGLILFITGFALDFAIHKVVNPLYKVLVCALIVIVFLLVWTELAVGAVSQMLTWLF